MTKPINFLDILWTNNDRQTLIGMVDEMIAMYGFQCILYRYIGSEPMLGDPLYRDTLSIFDRSPELYEKIDTWVYIDYHRFNQVLQPYGLALEDNTTLEGNMRLQDMPKEKDLIDIKLPYDDIFYRFEIGSTDVHEDIVFHVTLNVYKQDTYKDSGVIKYDILPDEDNKASITAKSTRIEVPESKQFWWKNKGVIKF